MNAKTLRMAARMTGAALLMATLSLPASAERRGDARMGKALAEAWCSSCHVVSDQPPQPATDAAPPFRSVANNPAKTHEYLRTWLLEPHLPMPNFQLAVPEIEDLIAYVESLRDQ